MKLEKIAWRALGACEAEQHVQQIALREKRGRQVERDSHLLTEHLKRSIAKDLATLHQIAPAKALSPDSPLTYNPVVPEPLAGYPFISVVADALPDKHHLAAARSRRLKTNGQIASVCELLRSTLVPIEYLYALTTSSGPLVAPAGPPNQPPGPPGLPGRTNDGATFDFTACVPQSWRDCARIVTFLRAESVRLQGERTDVQNAARKHSNQVRVLARCLEALDTSDKTTETGVWTGSEELRGLETEVENTHRRARNVVLARDRELARKKQQVLDLESELELAYSAQAERSKFSTERLKRTEEEPPQGKKPLPTSMWSDELLSQYVAVRAEQIEALLENMEIAESKADSARSALLDLLSDQEERREALRCSNVLQLVIMDGIRDSRRTVEAESKAAEKRARLAKAQLDVVVQDLNEVREALAALGVADSEIEVDAKSSESGHDLENDDATATSESSSESTPLVALEDAPAAAADSSAASTDADVASPTVTTAPSEVDTVQTGRSGSPSENGESEREPSGSTTLEPALSAPAPLLDCAAISCPSEGTSGMLPGGSAPSVNRDAAKNDEDDDDLSFKPPSDSEDSSDDGGEDPLVTPRLSIQDDSLAAFEQEIIERYQEALGTLFPDERIRLVDIKKAESAQNANSEAEQLELQKEFGYDGGEEARGEIPADLPEAVIEITGRLRRDWSRIMVVGADDPVLKDQVDPKPLRPSARPVSALPEGTAMHVTYGTIGESSSLDADIALPEEATVAPLAEVSAPAPTDIKDAFGASVSMRGDDPPPANDVEALLLEEMTAEEKVVRRLRSVDSFLDVAGSQLAVFEEAQFTPSQNVASPDVASAQSSRKSRAKLRSQRSAAASPTSAARAPVTSPTAATSPVATAMAVASPGPASPAVALDSGRNDHARPTLSAHSSHLPISPVSPISPQPQHGVTAVPVVAKPASVAAGAAHAHVSIAAPSPASGPAADTAMSPAAASVENKSVYSTSSFTVRSLGAGSASSSLSLLGEVEPGMKALTIEGKVEWVDRRTLEAKAAAAALLYPDDSSEEEDLENQDSLKNKVKKLKLDTEKPIEFRLRLWSEELAARKRRREARKKTAAARNEARLRRLHTPPKPAPKITADRVRQSTVNVNMKRGVEVPVSQKVPMTDQVVARAIGKDAISIVGQPLEGRRPSPAPSTARSNAEDVLAGATADLPDMTDGEFLQWMEDFIQAAEQHQLPEEEMLHNYAVKQAARQATLKARPRVGLSGLRGPVVRPGASGDLTAPFSVAGRASFPQRPPPSRCGLPEIQLSVVSGVKLVRREDGGYDYDFFEQAPQSAPGVLSKPLPRLARPAAAVDWDIRDQAGRGVAVPASAATSAEQLVRLGATMPALALTGDGLKLPDINQRRAASMSWSQNLPALVAALSPGEKQQVWRDFEQSAMSSAAQMAYAELAAPPFQTLPAISPEFDDTVESSVALSDAKAGAYVPIVSDSLLGPEDSNAQFFEVVPTVDHAPPLPDGARSVRSRSPSPSMRTTDTEFPEALSYPEDLESNEVHIAATLRSMLQGFEECGSSFWGDEPKVLTQPKGKTKRAHGAKTSARLVSTESSAATAVEPLGGLNGAAVSICGTKTRTQKRQALERAAPQPRTFRVSEPAQTLRVRALGATKAKARPEKPTPAVRGDVEGLGSTGWADLASDAVGMSLQRPITAPATPLAVLGGDLDQLDPSVPHSSLAQVPIPNPPPPPSMSSLDAANCQADGMQPLQPAESLVPGVVTADTSGVTSILSADNDDAGLVSLSPVVPSPGTKEPKIGNVAAKRIGAPGKTSGKADKGAKKNGKGKADTGGGKGTKKLSKKTSMKPSDTDVDDGYGSIEKGADEVDETNEDGADDDACASITLEEIIYDSVAAQPPVTVRGAKKAKDSAKKKEEHSWSNLTHQEIVKTKHVERALAAQKTSELEDYGSTGSLSLTASQIFVEFNRRRRQDTVGTHATR